MAVITARPSKRARVTAGPRPLDMRAFPAGGGGGGEGLPPPRGAFRECVRAFLARCAVRAGGAWRVGFRAGDGDGASLRMEVVEEDVARAGAARVYCEHCTVAGESACRRGRLNLFLLTELVVLVCSVALACLFFFFPSSSLVNCPLLLGGAYDYFCVDLRHRIVGMDVYDF